MNGGTMRLAAVAAVISMLIAAAPAGPARADGALAVGLPSDVANVGFANGYAYNAPSMERARSGAVEACHGSHNASDEAKQLCKVVATFHDQCMAVAIDPKDGTPGVGWAIAEGQSAADEMALAQCKTTAGADRQEFCKVTDRACDGNAH